MVDRAIRAFTFSDIFAHRIIVLGVKKIATNHACSIQVAMYRSVTPLMTLVQELLASLK